MVEILINYTLNLCSPFSLPPVSREQPVVFMSSAGQATSSSTSNSQLIIDALAEYTSITGIDLSRNSFAAELELSNSPQVILQLLQEHMEAFKGYRDGDRRPIDCLSSMMSVLQAFSGMLGEVVGGLVSERMRTII